MSNPVCGDVLRLAVIVEGGVVRKARFLRTDARLRCQRVGADGEMRADGWRVKEMHAVELPRSWVGCRPHPSCGQLTENGLQTILGKICG